MFKIFDKTEKQENKKNDLKEKFEERDKEEQEKKVQELKENLAEKNPEEK